MALFDLSSSWLEGTHCPLAARGYSRDGKKGKLQIEYGLLTDPELLAPLIARIAAGRLSGAAKIGVEVGKVINKYKTGKHFDVTITDDSLTTARRQAQIDAEATLTGSTSSAPPSPQASSAPPQRWPPTRTSPASSATSAPSRPTTWTCGRCSTGWKNA